MEHIELAILTTFLGLIVAYIGILNLRLALDKATACQHISVSPFDELNFKSILGQRLAYLDMVLGIRRYVQSMHTGSLLYGLGSTLFLIGMSLFLKSWILAIFGVVMLLATLVIDHLLQQNFGVVERLANVEEKDAL